MKILLIIFFMLLFTNCSHYQYQIVIVGTGPEININSSNTNVIKYSKLFVDVNIDKGIVGFQKVLTNINKNLGR